MAHGCFRCQKTCDCLAGDQDVTACQHCDDPEDLCDDDLDGPDELSDERCSECGAWPEEYHEMDCSFSDDDDDIEDDEDEDVEDFA